MVAVTALGLAAAFLFALSAFLQQRAARISVGADTASLRDVSGVKRLLGDLVRSRTWLTGWLTNVGGVGTQAAALGVVGLANASSTRRLYRATSADPLTTDTLGTDHGGVERQPCN